MIRKAIKSCASRCAPCWRAVLGATARSSPLLGTACASIIRSAGDTRKQATASLAGVVLFIMILATGAVAQAGSKDHEGDGATADPTAELANKLQNPVASLISVPLQSNFEWGGGRPQSSGFKYLLNIQPVIPVSISRDWNLISRTIVPLIHQDDVIPNSSQDGIGDIVQSGFISPKEPGPGGLIWGAGPVFLLPTTTERGLGAEKFGVGPTAVALRQKSGFTYGILANHIVSIGGTRNTPDVNATFVQPFFSYTTKTHTTFGLNTESTYDWENAKWTVPLNATVSQLLKLGGQPVSLQLGPKLYVEGPRGAADFGIRFAVTMLFPR